LLNLQATKEKKEKEVQKTTSRKEEEV